MGVAHDFLGACGEFGIIEGVGYAPYASERARAPQREHLVLSGHIGVESTRDNLYTLLGGSISPYRGQIFRLGRVERVYQFKLEIPKGLGSRHSVAGYGERWWAVIIVVAGAPLVGAELETVWESAARSTMCTEPKGVQRNKHGGECAVVIDCC